MLRRVLNVFVHGREDVFPCLIVSERCDTKILYSDSKRESGKPEAKPEPKEKGSAVYRFLGCMNSIGYTIRASVEMHIDDQH
jgi:hypothetical protein